MTSVPTSERATTPTPTLGRITSLSDDKCPNVRSGARRLGQTGRVTRASTDPRQRPIWPGTLGPSTGSPRRSVGSWRRTTSIDITFPTPGVVELRGTGRDLRATADGPWIVGEATTLVRVGMATRKVRAIETTPTLPTDPLIGVSAGGQFRRALGACLPTEVAAGTLAAQLLDDVPVATLIAGASIARRGLIPMLPSTPSSDPNARRPTLDICAGWRTGGEMARAVEEGDVPYLGEGPLALPLEVVDDPLAWHPMSPLPVGSMRRRRRIDFTPSPSDTGAVDFDVMFRDSFIEDDGRESAVHEYQVIGWADPDGVVRRIEAIARVLPGPECPVAVASALRLVGVALSEVRALVTGEFSGISTCTHLNDALRSIGAASLALTLRSLR